MIYSPVMRIEYASFSNSERIPSDHPSEGKYQSTKCSIDLIVSDCEAYRTRRVR
jgi:hypothetical protein